MNWRWEWNSSYIQIVKYNMIHMFDVSDCWCLHTNFIRNSADLISLITDSFDYYIEFHQFVMMSLFYECTQMNQLDLIYDSKWVSTRLKTRVQNYGGAQKLGLGQS